MAGHGMTAAAFGSPFLSVLEVPWPFSDCQAFYKLIKVMEVIII